MSKKVKSKKYWDTLTAARELFWKHGRVFRSDRVLRQIWCKDTVPKSPKKNKCNKKLEIQQNR